MILQSLARLSGHEHLVENPAYQFLPVSWVIELTSDGTFLNIIPLKTSIGKNKQVGKQFRIPARSKRTVNIEPEFLVDKPEYVLGIKARGEDPKTAQRHAAFSTQMIAAATETADPKARAVASFLQNSADMRRAIAQLNSSKYLDNDLITFFVDGEYVHDNASLHAYWERRFNSRPGKQTRQCLGCGEQKIPVELHPNVKQLAGASSSGVPLVSFNKPAFESYGWKGNDNAPLCQDCASAYVTAINRLLSDQTPNPASPGIQLPRQSRVVSQNQTVVYWTDDSNTGTEDLFASLYSNPQEVQHLLSAAFTADRIGRLHGSFHALILQGAQGRATVRSYHSQPVEAIWRNVRCWQQQIDIRPNSPISLLDILRSLAIKGKIERLPNGYSHDLYLSAAFGLPITHGLLNTAVARCRVSSKDHVPAARAALIAAGLVRSPLSNLTERTTLLNQNQVTHPTQAYMLGRLLALCERTQTIERQSNVTITDRFYSSLSTRPATAFGPLMKLNRAHLSRMRSPRLRIWIEGRIAEVMSSLGTELPATLNLINQGQFALGYYHEKWADRRDTEPTPDITKGESN